MSTETVYPHLEKPPGNPARLARLPRIDVATIIMDYLAHNWSADEICHQYPHLRPAEVHAAMAYYFDHPDEIKDEIQTRLRHDQAARKRTENSPLRLKLLAQRSR